MVSTFSTISYRVQSPLPVPSPFIFVTLCYSPNEIPNFRERADSYHMEQPTSQAPWLILPWLSNFLWRSLTSKALISPAPSIFQRKTEDDETSSSVLLLEKERTGWR
uniref:Uncharacterized protein n=1 Tax=Vespula pensylvanica TaxID=30213 RepID=A0A834UEY3_VESPE|nr:hypothetical protein H0235_003061 [Vespula pensylvanica]